MARQSTGSNRQHLIAFAAMLGLLLGGIAKTEAADYKFKFTKIADTAGFSDFFGPPALNDNGVVAFSAKPNSGPSGVFTGNGNGTTKIADSDGPFNIFDSVSPSLSDSGVLAFRVPLDAGGSAIVRSDRAMPIANSVLFKGHPSINGEGLVAFYQRASLFMNDILVSDGTTTTTIPHTSTLFFFFGENPSLNDRGAVAFSDDAGNGIFRSDGTTTTVIAQTSTSGPSGPYFNLGFFPSLNNEGAVAFFARLLPSGSGIFVGNGTTTTTIADSRGPFNSFGVSPSINDEGVVAFWATLRDGRHGIFTGPDPDAHKVIIAGVAAGDTLDGSTVTFLTFGREGLNNAGQVAFRAKLVDEGGRIYEAIYRADPVPSNVAPDCSAAQATPGTLWSPDHTLGTVAITGVTDPDNDPVAITVTSIRQDEPVNGRGDGNTAPDGVGVGSPLVMIRAERSGRGDGRVYHVSFTADDGRSGQCTGEVAVCVPHDQRPGAACVDQGPLFDSTVGPEGPGS